MSVHIRYLRPAVVSDLTHAEEDVPLIENGYLTEAGETYLESVADQTSIEVRELLDADKLVEAIRHHRVLTGASLLEAKTHIDRLRGR